jgi:hypothetical protein
LRFRNAKLLIEKTAGMRILATGTDVMILKIFSAKKKQKLPLFTQNKAKL